MLMMMMKLVIIIIINIIIIIITIIIIIIILRRTGWIGGIGGGDLPINLASKGESRKRHLQ